MPTNDVFMTIFYFMLKILLHPLQKKHFNLSLECHSSVHTGVKPQRCTHCNYSAKQGASLNKHILPHTAIVCNARIDPYISK